MQARYRNSLYVLPSSMRTEFVVENPHFIWIYPRKKRTPAACAFFFLFYGKLLVSGHAGQAKKICMPAQFAAVRQRAMAMRNAR